MKSADEIHVPDKINTADPEMDHDDSELYQFPDLHMWVCVDGGCSEEEARKIAIRTIEEMEMDGFEMTDHGFQKRPGVSGEPPWYDDGRRDGEPRKKYRWREMFKLYRQLGRPLTAEEAALFEVKNEEDEGRQS